MNEDNLGILAPEILDVINADENDRPPLSDDQAFDPFGSLFDDRWSNDDF